MQSLTGKLHAQLKLKGKVDIGGQILVPAANREIGGFPVKKTSQHIRASQDRGGEGLRCYTERVPVSLIHTFFAKKHVIGYFQLLLKAVIYVFMFHQQNTLNSPLPDIYLE